MVAALADDRAWSCRLRVRCRGRDRDDDCSSPAGRTLRRLAIRHRRPALRDAAATRLNEEALSFVAPHLGGRQNQRRRERELGGGRGSEIGTSRLEIERGDDGSVRQIVTYDSHGNVVAREIWSNGGKRVDYVEEDGKTPRHRYIRRYIELTPITTVLREFDPHGYIAREMFLGAVPAVPARTGAAAYGMPCIMPVAPGAASSRCRSWRPTGSRAPSPEARASSSQKRR